MISPQLRSALALAATCLIGIGVTACGGERAAEATSTESSAAASSATEAATASSAAPAETTPAAAELTGTVSADGSSTVGPFVTAGAEAFQAANPKVQVTVGISGTGGGFERFCNGETDLSNASRSIKDEEAAACKEKGVEYAEFIVANDGISLVTNKENTWATCLTVEQLASIWGPDSKAASWKDVDPAFEDVKLSLYGPGTDSGTFDFFTKAINGEEGASRSDYTASEDDNVTVEGVSGEKGGLGYFGFSYYEANKDKLTLVQVDGGKGCKAPDSAIDPGRHLRAAVAPALRLRHEDGARPARGGSLRQEPHRGRGRRSPRLRSSCRSRPTRWRRRRASSPPRVSANQMSTSLSSDPPIPRTSQGGPVIRSSARRSSPRYGERVIMALLVTAAALSIATTIGIVVALLRPAIEFFQEVPILDFLGGDRWAPLFKPASFGVLPLLVGTLIDDDLGRACRDPLRAGRRDLPERVREATSPQRHQAGARGARRHSDGRVRVLRADVVHAAVAGHRRATASASSTCSRPAS